MSRGGLIGDFGPQPKGIVLAEVACGGLGADFEVVVAVVRAGRRREGEEGLLEVGKGRVRGRGCGEVGA